MKRFDDLNNKPIISGIRLNKGNDFSLLFSKISTSNLAANFKNTNTYANANANANTRTLVLKKQYY